MTPEDIIKTTDDAVEKLSETFVASPTLFYTENDLVCSLYCLLHSHLGPLEIFDKDGCRHTLLHTEYPTPFRCDMAGANFQVMSDDERKEKGNKYKRGHYDLVVLNPDFIRSHSYQVIKAQHYDVFRQEALTWSMENGAAVLFGIELMYSRNPLKQSRGTDKYKALNDYINMVRQDADKLLESVNIGFTQKARMVVFIKGTSPDIAEFIRVQLSDGDKIMCCFA